LTIRITGLTSLVIQNKNITQSLRILLPLSRENISSYLSPLLGQFAIKPGEFLSLFIEKFDAHTNFLYTEDFDDFLNEKISFLSYTNLTIPVQVTISMEFNKVTQYSILINYPTVWALITNFFFKKKKFI
jgi:hypothetical protein